MVNLQFSYLEHIRLISVYFLLHFQLIHDRKKNIKNVKFKGIAQKQSMKKQEKSTLFIFSLSKL